MNTSKPADRQATSAALGRQIHQRMATFGTLDLLYEAIELQARGEIIAAKHLVERVIDTIEDGGRREADIILAMADLPPAFAFDAALHARRHPFLDRHDAFIARTTKWSGEMFTATDQNEWFLTVMPSDAWCCSDGQLGGQVNGLGLLTLHAHLTCQTVDVAAAGLAPWLEKIQRGGAA
ncbi:hypothetical protein B5K11_11765 [Rhizobium leguminosarum bv. trifolii]|uniref:hypothetical protein n=1 Tax=Rhizobium leguminosarum TaxID=384 RepID=UPI000E2FE3CD|nr:hypothetical protein [Rhizobium leguminosarum]RFB95580.1 hypothetical protein B5K11_11765 [Rhizobium leguminosarum bv. trifolii]